MKIVTAILFVALLQVGFIDCQSDYKEIIDKVNRLHTTWNAGINMYNGAPLLDSRPLLGQHFDVHRDKIPIKTHPETDRAEIPVNFDSRKQWPQCSTVNDIHNQGNCGICWATATAGVLSDRECIHNGKIFRYSAENLATCGRQFTYSCEGGFPSDAMIYWKNKGLVSGDYYGLTGGCQPFSKKLFDGNEVPCRRQCTNTQYPTSYDRDLHYGNRAYAITPRRPVQMQQEIMTNGPVVVSFTVYQDFNYYQSGVYQHVTGGYSGRHAVRIIGWGVEKGIPYWLVANSWGEYWGENGLFKILRGNDECGIESVVDAGLP